VTITRSALLTLGAVLLSAAVRAQDSAVAKRPTLHLVAMVERGQYGIAFEPMRTYAAPGDTVRFMQQGALPHNVRFRSGPPGAAVDSLESPMLSVSGTTWDVVLDSRFVPGKYHFVCVPHETLGMAGLLYVEPPGAAP
jgi:plastocyanin